MQSTVRIRPYRSGDEHALAALFARCFGRPMGVAHWMWKVKHEAAPYENVWVVTENGRPVAQYVGMPVTAWSGSADVAAIVIFDTMVDPELRRRGILKRMGGHAHDAWREAGVHFGIGLPNEQWGSTAAALGWQPLFPFRWLLRVLRPESILARRSGIDGLSRLSYVGTLWRGLYGFRPRDPDIGLQCIDAPHEDLDVVAAAARAGDVTSLARGRSWTERRYLSCPDVDYRVLLARRGSDAVGYAVFRMRRAAALQVVVTELVTRDDDRSVFNTLVQGIERIGLEAGAESLLVLAVSGSPRYRRFARYGFVPRKAAFTLQFVPFRPEYAKRQRRKDWDFMGGDFDVV